MRDQNCLYKGESWNSFIWVPREKKQNTTLRPFHWCSTRSIWYLKKNLPNTDNTQIKSKSLLPSWWRNIFYTSSTFPHKIHHLYLSSHSGGLCYTSKGISSSSYYSLQLELLDILRNSHKKFTPYCIKPHFLSPHHSLAISSNVFRLQNIYQTPYF